MIIELDNQLMLLLNHDGGAWADAFWWGISHKFTWVPLYAALLYCLLSLPMAARPETSGSPVNPARRLWSLLWLVVCTALLIVVADRLSSGLIKPWVARPRPSHQPGVMEWLHYVGDYRGGAYGFVSSHAANTLALVLWVSRLCAWRRSWLLPLSLWALANCYSRIYLGVHYPGDILGGAVVAALSYFYIVWLYRCGVQRMGLMSPVAMCDAPNAAPPPLPRVTQWLPLAVVTLSFIILALQAC